MNEIRLVLGNQNFSLGNYHNGNSMYLLRTAQEKIILPGMTTIERLFGKLVSE